MAHCVVEFQFPRQPVARRRYWMVATLEDVDVCLVDPGFAVDIVVRADLAALTKVWMGDSCFVDEMRSNRIEATGPRSLVRCLPEWLGQHPVLASVKPGRVG